MKVFVLISLQQSRRTNVIPPIWVIHAISGCDTVAASHGIGKLKAIATSNKGFLLDSLDVADIPWDSVEDEETKFMIAACGGSGVTMTWVPPADVGAKNNKALKCPRTVFPCAGHRGI